MPFKNEEEFKRKIKENKDFRIRVQKLVYLSEFFGWENTYHYNFHERGPYSIELEKDYQNITIPKEQKNFNFRIDSFNNFIEISLMIFLKLHPQSFTIITKLNQESLIKKK